MIKRKLLQKTYPKPTPGRIAAVAAFYLLVLLALIYAMRNCRRHASDSAAKDALTAGPHWNNLVFPTDVTNLTDGIASGAFQPTVSGRPESALYGSVRTASSGYPSFHEGIDIRSLQKDRRGVPLDNIYAINDGVFAYANRITGNSNYGKYVVLIHHDAVGEVYSLYAHLASVTPELKPGMPVKAGDIIGIMGNTPPGIIPPERAHLHFEIGLVINSRFPEWLHSHYPGSKHEVFHGWNLLGLDPLEFLRQATAPGFSFLDFIQTVPTAFELVIKTNEKPLDFFIRYPALWKGTTHTPKVIVAAFSENGLPLSGRPASPDEQNLMQNNRYHVLSANKEVLGRNGRRLILQRGNQWQLSKRGREWLGILLFPIEI